MHLQPPPQLTPGGPFDYQPRTRVIFGVNAVEQVGGLALRARGAEGPAGDRQRDRLRRARGAREPAAGGRRPHHNLFRPGRGKPRHPMRRAMRRVGASGMHRRYHRSGRRQQHGYGQRLQFPPDQRRARAGLLGYGKGQPADAAVHRHPHHGRHRQRVPVFRPHHRRAVSPKNGLRRPESRRAHRRARSGAERLPTAPRHRLHGH